MGVIHRIGKKLFFGRFQKAWRWPEQVPQSDWEHVWLQSGNGARLAAVFGAARTERERGAVVLAHPLGAAAKAFWVKHGHAELLRKSGFHVLAFDFNGFGESESANFDYPSDVIAAGHYLRDRSALPVGVIGCSFGAGYALCAMERDDHPFRAAILEGSFATLPGYWRPYPFPRMALRLSQVVYPRLERTLRPLRAAGQLKSQPHILLIHGEADTVTPVALGHQLKDAMSGHGSAELWTVPDAEHALAFRAQPEDYARRVVDFLDTAFKTTSGRRTDTPAD